MTARTAVLIVVVGVLGTWRHTGPVSLDGLQGPHDGWLAIMFALIALAGASLRSRVAIALVVACGAAIVYFAVRNLVDDRAALGGSSGWGIWLTIAGGVALVAASALAAYRK